MLYSFYYAMIPVCVEDGQMCSFKDAIACKIKMMSVPKAAARGQCRRAFLPRLGETGPQGRVEGQPTLKLDHLSIGGTSGGSAGASAALITTVCANLCFVNVSRPSSGPPRATGGPRRSPGAGSLLKG